MSIQFGCATLEWTREMNLKLIEELKKRTSLWDVNSLEYRDKTKRKMDYQELAAVFAVPCTEIEKKIHNLKSQFRREFRRSKAKTSSTPYKSKWYGFRLLKFLKEGENEVKAFKGPSKISQSANWSSSTDVTSATGSADLPSSTVPASPDKVSTSCEEHLKDKERFAKSKDMFYRIVKKKKNTQKQDRDEHTVFGEYVTYELRKIVNPYILTITKHKIQEALFEAQMSMLSSACDFNGYNDDYLPLVSQNLEDGQKTSSIYSSCSSLTNTPSPPPS